MRRDGARLAADRRGQSSLEYALLLAAVVLPAMTVFLWLLSLLARAFWFVTLLQSTPFP